MKDSMIRYRTMRDLVPQETLAVVDTSAFWTHIDDSFFQDNEDKRLDAIATEIGMYHKLDRGWRDNFVFPKETIAEFNDRTERMEIWAEWTYRNGMPAVGDALRKLMYSRDAFVGQIMKTHRLEDRLTREIKEIYLPHITNATKAVSLLRGVRKKPSRARYLGSNKKNSENDAVAFAKCVALSYVGPVIKISGDVDIVRMARRFYADNYPRRYGFPRPAHSVQIISPVKGGLKIYSAGEFQRKVEFAAA